jgi:hypothetical protein
VTRQPEEIDYSAPIADDALALGLLAVWPLRPAGGGVLSDLASAHDGLLENGTSWRPDPAFGDALHLDSSVGNHFVSGDGLGAIDGSPATLLVMFRTAFVSSGQRVFSVGVFGSECTIGTHSGTSLNVRYGASSDIDVGAVADITTREVIAVMTVAAVDGGGNIAVRLYDGGAEIISVTKTVALAGGGGWKFGGLSGNGFGQFTGQILFGAAWNRELSPAEVWEVSQNPWRLLRPVVRTRGLRRSMPVTYSVHAVGVAIVRNALALELVGKFKAALDPFVRDERGAYLQLEAYAQAAAGAARTLNSFAPQAIGGYKVGYAPFAGEAAGGHRAYVAAALEARGAYKSGYTSFGRDELGAHRIYAGYVVEALGGYAFLIACAQESGGKYRVANAALDRYELYRGVNAPADLTAAPYMTFTALPAFTAVLPGSTTYHFVLRKRNAWGLVSENISEWVVTLDAGGNPVVVRPSDPIDIAVTPGAGGTAVVTARYLYAADGINQANQFLVYVAVNATPVIGVTSPVVIAMSKSDGVAKLSYTTAAQSNGSTVNVIVRTRRTGSPNVDSAGTTVYSCVVSTAGPGVMSPRGLFIGTADEQRQ